MIITSGHKNCFIGPNYTIASHEKNWFDLGRDIFKYFEPQIRKKSEFNANFFKTIFVKKT